MYAVQPNPAGEEVWRSRYRGLREDGSVERGPAETLERVARALAAPEADALLWTRRFGEILGDFRFLPGGRILAGAGGDHSRTLLNCFVMGRIEDSLEGVLTAVGEGMRTLSLGGGTGWDLSTLSPRGDGAPGPVGCLELLDAACAAFSAGGDRGGAMMGTLSASHPDVIRFIRAKQRAGVLPRFNISLQLGDDFMLAVSKDAGWSLQFPPDDRAGPFESMPARSLWRHFIEAAWAGSEPGALFVDTINRENNLWWCERLTTTNPCGEAPLPPYGACDLGSLNLAAFVREPFARHAEIDLDSLRGTARVAVRLLDNVLDLTRYPLEAQRAEAQSSRRIGLGVTALADALAMLRLRYDSAAGRAVAAEVMEQVKLAAYEASVALARERGPFPRWDRSRYLDAPFVARLPGPLRDRIAAAGMRNSHLLAIAPTGSISLLAGNVSTGIEPIQARRQVRTLRSTGGGPREVEIEDFAWRRFLAAGRPGGDEVFVEGADVTPEDQVSMQAAVQPHVDGAVSKTVLLPDDYAPHRLDALFYRAHREGLKGLAVHRRASARGNVDGPGCAGSRPGDAVCGP